MSAGTKYPNGENIFNPDGSFNPPNVTVSEILEHQKRSFEWSKLTQEIMQLWPDEVPIVTEYVKRFIASRPKNDKASIPSKLANAS